MLQTIFLALLLLTTGAISFGTASSDAPSRSATSPGPGLEEVTGQQPLFPKTASSVTHHQDLEPNDHLGEAQWLGFSPTPAGRHILHGRFQAPVDVDCFAWELSPGPGGESHRFSFIYRQRPTLLQPKLTLLQTLLDGDGKPVGHETLFVGTAQGDVLAVKNLEVPGSSDSRGDVLLRIEWAKGPVDVPGYIDYGLQFWSR